MRKFIITILMTLMVATAAMAKPITKVVYEAETQGVILYVDTDSYGAEIDITSVYGELKAHKNYFVWNINEKKFEIGSAFGMDMWMDTFGNLFKYVDDLIEDGYSTASLVFATDGFENSQIKGIFTVTNNGYVYGFWEY